MELNEMKDSSLNNTNKDNGIKTSRLNTNQSQLYESLNKKTNLDQKVETGEIMDKKKYSKTNSCKISPRNLNIIKFSNNYEGINFQYQIRRKRNTI